MDSPAAALFYSHLTLILLWMAWVLLGRDLRADLLRSRLREFRNELVDFAASHADSRRHPEYRVLVQWTEQALRDGDQITLTRVLLSAPLAPRRSPQPHPLQEWERRLCRLLLRHAWPVWTLWRTCPERQKDVLTVVLDSM